MANAALAFVADCARATCACRSRVRRTDTLPGKSVVSANVRPLARAVRSVLFLDGSELIQSDGDVSVAGLNELRHGFHVRGASWKDSSVIAEMWIRLARDGQLGSLWPRVERIAATRLAAASAYHVGKHCFACRT